MLDLFKWTKYLFTIQAQDELILSPFKGSTFRGGFGNAFQKIVCSYKERENCNGCLLTNLRKCTQTFYFRTTIREENSL